jgi:hypothetical protein
MVISLLACTATTIAPKCHNGNKGIKIGKVSSPATLHYYYYYFLMVIYRFACTAATWNLNSKRTTTMGLSPDIVCTVTATTIALKCRNATA